MKRKLQSTILVAASLLCSEAAFSQTPVMPVKSDFGTSVSDVSTFVPATSGDYTLEVQGTANTEIVVKGGTYSYTPTTDSKVRFVKRNSTVYVYEGSSYKGTATVSEPATPVYPTIEASDVSGNSAQLLDNAGFETQGAYVDNNIYKFGSPWISNATIKSGGIRVEAYNSTSDHVVVWRGSGNTDYFCQALSSKIKPNTYYKVQVCEVAGSNADAYFNVGLGSTENNMDYCSSQFLLGKSYVNTYSKTIKTPATVANTVYFTFGNTSTSSITNSTESDPLTRLTYVSLVAATNSPCGITGATSATYLEGTSYAPGDITYADGADATISNIVNPSFETGAITPWTAATTSGDDTGVKSITQNTNKYATTGTDGSYLFNTWSKSSTAYQVQQTVSNLPCGFYTLSALTASDNGNKVEVYAGTSSANVAETAAGTFVDGTTPLIYVTEGGSIAVGAKSTTWFKADNFRLTYYNPSYVNNYTGTLTSLLKTASDKWDTESNINKSNLKEHWDGTTTSTYFESNSWGSTSWNSTRAQSVSLPAGTYLIKVAGRAASGVTASMSVADGTNTYTTYFPSKGNTGLGITKTGEINFTAAATGTDVFANSNNGYGWEWRFIPFTLTAAANVTITFNATSSTQKTWYSISNDYSLLTSDNILSLDETSTTEPTLTDATGQHVLLNRSLSANHWNTICLPFAISSSDIATMFGTDTKVAEYASNDGTTLHFTTLSGNMQANVPYIIKPTGSTSLFYLKTDVENGTPEKSVSGSNQKFVGTYAKKTVPEGDYFIGNGDDTFYKVGTGATVNIKAFRGYFTNEATAKQMDINIDGEATSITKIDESVVPSDIYNLNGQLVRSKVLSTGGLTKGVYIVNGKKMVVR